MMNRRRILLAVLMLAVGVLVSAGVVAAREASAPDAEPLSQTPAGMAFTYEGRLDRNGAPADGNFDFTFRLFDSSSDGFQIGETVAVEGVVVSKGLFNGAVGLWR